MLQLALVENFKRNVLEWYGTMVHFKQTGCGQGNTNITKRKIRQVVMQTVEPDYTKEYTGGNF